MSIWEVIENEGLVAVADIGEYDYSWSEMRVFYQPTSRRFFWYEDSGCSCNSWGDYVKTLGEFSDGDKAAAMRALDASAAGLVDIKYASTSEEIAAAKAAIRNFLA